MITASLSAAQPFRSTTPIKRASRVYFSARTPSSSNPTPTTPRPSFFKRVLQFLWAPFKWIFQQISRFFAWLAGSQSTTSTPAAQPATPQPEEPLYYHERRQLEERARQAETARNQAEAALKAAQVHREITENLQRALAALTPEQQRAIAATQSQRLAILTPRINAPLGYSHQPPVTNPPSIDKSDLPTQKTVSQIRANIPVFSPPSLADIQAGKGHFIIPAHGGIRPVINANAAISNQAHTQAFLAETQPRRTDFKLDYGRSSLNWSEQKVARDIVQNFYDGHGQTLEGVEFEMTLDRPTGQYTVTIKGQAEYNHEELEALGGGSKRDSLYNAGGYGEGAKAVAARLIATQQTEAMTFASSDWQLTFSAGAPGGDDKDYMCKRLQRVTKIRGNSLSFKTTNANLIKALLEATHYFYHPGNPDYQKPTFENKEWGFRYVGLTGRGNLYITQRFEGPDNQWNESLPQITLFTKRKPAAGLIDSSRDRTSISSDQIEKTIREDFIKTCTTSELLQILTDLQDIWSPDHVADTLELPKDKRDKVREYASIKLLESCLWELTSRGIQINFPPNYISYSNGKERISQDLLEHLKKKGYQLCLRGFEYIGMKTVTEHLIEQRNHDALQPTPEEIQKINILKLAAQSLVSNAQYTHTGGKLPLIRQQDVDQPIYLFNAASQKDYKDTLAEAITAAPDYSEPDGWHAEKRFKGAWFDRTYLQKASFEEALATYLHELTHQYGGDGESRFGYALTDWFSSIKRAILKDPAVYIQLRDLMACWDKVNNPAALAA